MTSEQLREILRDDVLEASRVLLGCVLVRGERSARIVETEAYRWDEAGCHAFRGPTPRTQVMYGSPGLAYVYFTYGVHWMLNIVAHEPGNAAAVLIRAAEPLTGLDEMRLHRPKAARPQDLLSGPGKIAAAFEIHRPDNGLDLLDRHSSLHILPGQTVSRVLVGTRIGLAKGKGDELPWRFVDADALQWVSKPHPVAWRGG